MTGDQYRDSLRDGRASYLDGKRVEDPASHPLLRAGVDIAAHVYDHFHRPDPDAYCPAYALPRNAEDLRGRANALGAAGSDMVVNTSGVICMALATAAPKLAQAKPEYRDHIYKFIEHCRDNDVRCAETITDAKGHRKLRPRDQDDPDFYVRVVDRNADGIFITGAKMHISAAAIVHELVILPTKAMRPGEEEYAVACSVPANAPGVTIINSTYAPRGDDTRHYPVSRLRNTPEGFVVFDRVFVPYDRVFLDGEVEHSAVLAHALGLWERGSGVARSAERGDKLVGFAALAAEAAGIEKEPFVRDRLAALMVYSTIRRALAEAAMENGIVNEDGYFSPSELHVSTMKHYTVEEHHRVADILHELAGPLLVNAPTWADYDNPELQKAIQSAFSDKAFTAEQRLKLLHFLRDISADTFGGWGAAAESLSGGGQRAQQLVTLRHYDLETAKQAAREVMGLDGGEALIDQVSMTGI